MYKFKINIILGRPGICLCVSGPGMVHGVAGFYILII